MLLRKFAPKRDWWVWPSAIFSVILAGIAMAVSVSNERAIGFAIVCALYAIWRIARILTTWYELRGSELVVVRWPFRRGYAFDNIVRLRALNRLEVPPKPGAFLSRRNEAFSYNVLVVEMYQGQIREVYISPNDRADFLQHFRFRAPHVTVDA